MAVVVVVVAFEPLGPGSRFPTYLRTWLQSVQVAYGFLHTAVLCKHAGWRCPSVDDAGFHTSTFGPDNCVAPLLP